MTIVVVTRNSKPVLYAGTVPHLHCELLLHERNSHTQRNITHTFYRVDLTCPHPPTRCFSFDEWDCTHIIKILRIKCYVPILDSSVIGSFLSAGLGEIKQKRVSHSCDVKNGSFDSNITSSVIGWAKNNATLSRSKFLFSIDHLVKKSQVSISS